MRGQNIWILGRIDPLTKQNIGFKHVFELLLLELVFSVSSKPYFKTLVSNCSFKMWFQMCKNVVVPTLELSLCWIAPRSAHEFCMMAHYAGAHDPSSPCLACGLGFVLCMLVSSTVNFFFWIHITYDINIFNAYSCIIFDKKFVVKMVEKQLGRISKWFKNEKQWKCAM